MEILVRHEGAFVFDETRPMIWYVPRVRSTATYKARIVPAFMSPYSVRVKTCESRGRSSPWRSCSDHKWRSSELGIGSIQKS